MIRDGVGAPLLIQVIGQQRSGNHAIISWLSSLFENAGHANDRTHDYLRDPARIARINAATDQDCTIVSFEDSGNHLPRGRRLLDSVGIARPEDFPGRRVVLLHILRDPYNCWASRAKAQDTSKLTSSPQVEDFIADWLDLAEVHHRHPEKVVTYNDWFRSEDYRRALCARLGGTYSEATLNEVVSTGGGSSFDGYGRPAYRDIVARSDRYLSRRFVRRFFRKPGNYLQRLVTTRPDGRQLSVESRWEYLLGHPSGARLLGDEALRRRSEEIFGFSIDPQGRVREPAPLPPEPLHRREGFDA